MKETGVRDIIFASKVLLAQNICQAENLLHPRLLFNSFGADKTAVVNGKAVLILDFGQEYVGGLRILTKQVHNIGHRCAVRIRFGESVGECCSELGEKNSSTAHSLRDISTDLLSMSDMTFANTGFRFVRLDFQEDVQVELTAVVAIFTHCGVEAIGSFCCEDERINEIYRVAQRTIYLNLQNEVIWDGIKRDRLVWFGDLNPELAAAVLSFGNIPNLKNSLAAARDFSSLPCWINDIPSYSLWYIQCVYDYYRYTGDRQTVREHSEYISELLSYMDACVQEDGKLDFSRVNCHCDMPYFIDWNTYGQAASEAGVVFLLYWVCKNTEELFRAVGTVSEPPGRILRKLMPKVSLDSSPKPIISLAVLSGIEDAGKAAPCLLKDGTEGYSSFMSYYISRALFRAGECRKAVSLMREYFGGMLDRGATTFWEDFDTAWIKGSGKLDEFPSELQKDIHGDFGKHCYRGYRHSLCHGWASWPAAFLVEQIAGIQIVKRGFAEIRLAPQDVGLHTMKVCCPTPYGVIDLAFHKAAEKWEVQGRIPSPIEVTSEKNVDFNNVVRGIK